jgi:hypothetical protein
MFGVCGCEVTNCEVDDIVKGYFIEIIRNAICLFKFK